MRAIVRASGAAVAAVAWVAVTAPAASADDESWQVGVEPATVRPGDTVTLTSRGCQVPEVTVDSGVFDHAELNEGRETRTRVSPDAKPAARHEVTFTCDGRSKTVQVTIADDGRGQVGKGPESADHRPDQQKDPSAERRPEQQKEPDRQKEPERQREPDRQTELDRQKEPGHRQEPGHRNESEHRRESERFGPSERKGVQAGSGGGIGEIGPVQLTLGSALVAGSLGSGVYFAVRRRTSD
ncbi:hypothetical protein ACFVT5_38680 [Streptomyces sp. NPDC058001]|uniref:hypothetical protein n=1 Tax=Streptomyces sp. NPDC058001 TaxID=3346300 RepID=UPI0036F191E1